ncbi:putative choline transporter, neither null mutation nor overexpression affects choline transport [Boothiomyces macroporosus]|uniref:Protein PNS1 n=1 Tax=Boothiomyces macroporosus TaxID=261099 RepID=A0AAD5Y8F7_9FUNG|nr:putative choline transporter, neither null mutation nor overexpression affects choline transport [Boothiomyces macroporosus]
MSSPPVYSNVQLSYTAQSQQDFLTKKEESVSNAVNNSSANGNAYYGPDAHQSGLLAGYMILIVFSGFMLCLGYLIALQKFAGTIIHITLVLAILLYAAGAIAAAVYQIYTYTIVAALLAALNIYLFWAKRDKIPLAKVILKTVTHVTGKYSGIIGFAVLGLLFQVIFALWWGFTLTGLIIGAINNQISNGFFNFLIFYMVFMFYWVTQIISNSVHLTSCGTFASYYFLGVSDGHGNVNIPIQNPTAASFKRAWTTSLGSNCFGSLLIALFQMLHSSARNRSGNSNSLGSLCSCCCACLFAIFGDILRYFNVYAFVQVAIYGKDYCTAAKSTLNLLRARGIEPIINDCFTHVVLNMGSLFISAIIVGLGVLYMYLAFDYALYQELLPAAIIVGFFVSQVEFHVLGNVIRSGVATSYVCMAEDPEALRNTKPELYEKVNQAYPQILTPV